MIKPVSPTEWDAATPRQRRGGIVPATRPTQESYEAAMAEYEVKKAHYDKIEALMNGLRKMGGREWSGGKHYRFYFGNSYFDLKAEAFVEAEGGMTSAEFNTARAAAGF